MPHDVCPWRYAYLFDNPVRRLFHDPARLLEQKLIAEPKIHVTDGDLSDTIEIAEQTGWEYMENANIRLSHSAVFTASTSTAD